MFFNHIFSQHAGMFSGAGHSCVGGGHGFFAHHKHGLSHEDLLKHFSDELDLTEEQNKKVASIIEEVKQRHAACGEIHTDAFGKIQAELKSDKLNKETFRNLFDMEKSCKSEMHEFFIDKMADFHSILTPEQRNKLADKLTKHHGCCC